MGFIYCNIGGIVCSVSSLWDDKNISENMRDCYWTYIGHHACKCTSFQLTTAHKVKF